MPFSNSLFYSKKLIPKNKTARFFSLTYDKYPRSLDFPAPTNTKISKNRWGKFLFMLQNNELREKYNLSYTPFQNGDSNTDPWLFILRDKTKENLIEGLAPLLNSLSKSEKEQTLKDMESQSVVKRSAKLPRDLKDHSNIISSNHKESRTTFLAALRCLREKKITVNQLASLHIVDSAVRTLYTAPISYMIHEYMKDGVLNHITTMNSVYNDNGLPDKINRSYYNFLPTPNASIDISQMPKRMRKPLLSRFFNFQGDEWNNFCSEMRCASESEKYFTILNAPKYGCWSSIISTIQDNLSCIQVIDWIVQTDSGNFLTEKIMLVPSFTMFQAALNVKAMTLGREPIKLVPTYGYVDEYMYALLKTCGDLAFTLHMPNSSIEDQFEIDRSTIDGHFKETAFAGAIHDFYHASRTMMMKPSIADAVNRLAIIATLHPKNKITPKSRAVHEILFDGELIFNYSLHKDTIFKHEMRPSRPEVFGDLFYVSSLSNSLHVELKIAFIKDMVVYKSDWMDCFHIGRDDLLEDDQYIYDDIERQHTAYMSRMVM
ncbi:MAG: hypothetical protein P1U74_11460 [Legionellaceae bacterium]|nr:hypothetical protein [Legionellaceae bacterium]